MTKQYIRYCTRATTTMAKPHDDDDDDDDNTHTHPLRFILYNIIMLSLLFGSYCAIRRRRRGKALPALAYTRRSGNAFYYRCHNYYYYFIVVSATGIRRTVKHRGSERLPRRAVERVSFISVIIIFSP